MQQKVAEFMANLLATGIDRAKVAEMGYSYALALQTDELSNPGTAGLNVASRFMFAASEIVRDAMPEADKINHERCRVKPIPHAAQIGVDREAVRRALRKDRADEE